MAYFVMTCEGEYPSASIVEEPELDDNTWQPVAIDVASPLLYLLDPEHVGKPLALYDAEAFPVMRNDLIDALIGAGVDNIELFDAILKNTRTGNEYKNYKAFNIVGLVSAVDMGKSVFMGTSSSRILDADFES